MNFALAEFTIAPSRFGHLLTFFNCNTLSRTSFSPLLSSPSRLILLIEIHINVPRFLSRNGSSVRDQARRPAGIHISNGRVLRAEARRCTYRLSTIFKIHQHSKYRPEGRTELPLPRTSWRYRQIVIILFPFTSKAISPPRDILCKLLSSHCGSRCSGPTRQDLCSWSFRLVTVQKSTTVAQKPRKGEIWHLHSSGVDGLQRIWRIGRCPISS